MCTAALDPPVVQRLSPEKKVCKGAATSRALEDGSQLQSDYFKGLRPWAGSAGRSAGRAVSKHFEAPKL